MAPGAPFVPGLPEQTVLSPDGDARRAAYQRTGKGRGHHGGGEGMSSSTLALSPGVPSASTPDGVGDGMNGDAGNQFPRTTTFEGDTGNGTPGTDSGSQSVIPNDVVPTAPEQTRPAPPTQSTKRADHQGDKVNIYESGMYWKLLD